MKNDILWCEIYRPKTVQECILPQHLKDMFQQYVYSGVIPNMLLTGSPGVGKTSIAKALCAEVLCDFIIINGSDENGIDVLRGKIKNYASTVSLSGGRKIVILDEADYITANAQAALRNLMDEFSSNCSFILTCNYKNKIIEPLHSRCVVIEFKITKEDKRTLMLQFMKRVCMILDKENIPYTKSVIAPLIEKYYPDNRRLLNELQRYSQSGSIIDVGILAAINDINVLELISYLKDKDFTNIRRWVSTNSDIDSNAFFRRLYDTANDHLQPTSIPQLVLIIGKYQFQASFVADQELNNLAFLVEVLCECTFK